MFKKPHPRAVILKAPGTNCDIETKFAGEKVGFLADILHIRRISENPSLLMKYQLLIIPGGFSYGDDLGAGKILTNEIKFKFGDWIRSFIEKGNLILGICNGFQVLVKSGLLPYPFGQQVATLMPNDSGRFEARWVHLKVCSTKSVFIRGDEILELPVAHGEGKFFVGSRSNDFLGELESNGQIVLKYVSSCGGENPGYPANPNGSVGDIAGVSDPSGKILGLMPHPERYVLPLQYPRHTRSSKRKPDGIKFFENARDYITQNLL